MTVISKTIQAAAEAVVGKQQTQMGAAAGSKA
jgi:hypothetical protein